MSLQRTVVMFKPVSRTGSESEILSNVWQDTCEIIFYHKVFKIPISALWFIHWLVPSKVNNRAIGQCIALEVILEVLLLTAEVFVVTFSMILQVLTIFQKY